MYIAGINIPLTTSQAVEVAVSCTTFFSFVLAFKQAGVADRVARTDGGSVQADSEPKSLPGKMVTPVHNVAFMVPIITFPVAVGLNCFRQPGWMLQWALPNNIDGCAKAAVRLAACGMFLGVWQLVGWTLEHLGSQFHCIARREKSQIVSSGPYAVVRHPLYGFLLVQHALCSVMFWSYVPLAGLLISAVAFSVKMPIEEKIMVEDPAIGAEYMDYQDKVTSRIIPYIW
ncbi:hypothetical protein BJ138DRAFT_1139083 [Hygrophoropsis aurantiaca]|uniref:Uncharacterized protein n=1 Tax=Hygrophoropsis aurantiaca TaxID=72124 RepID=A0ACB8AU16_9AGAM|nr:hypothetical protein BJ138DRAFT_1139083 [Hygrophoropsis aurantiaca]